jgi:hypothetical protein
MQGCDSTPGSLRTVAGWAKGPGRTRVWRRFPEAGAVRSGLADLDAELRAERDPVRAAARAYAGLFVLHPFRNGNGRVMQAIVPILLRERRVLSRPCLLLGATFDRRVFVPLVPSGDVGSFIDFALSAIESAATDAAAACAAIAGRFEEDERRLPGGAGRRLLRRLAGGALPIRDVGTGRAAGLRALRRGRIARVVPGLFGEPVVFHVGLARIVSGQTGARRVSSMP